MTMGAAKAISPFNWYLFLSVFIAYVCTSSPLLSCILTPIIDSQPKSRLAFVNTRKYLSAVVSVSKRTRNGKHDESRKPLVGHSDSKEHKQEERKHEKQWNPKKPLAYSMVNRFTKPYETPVRRGDKRTQNR